jgi:hypothetical protein
MRGAEHPASVRWTRPFLEPLQPLTSEAAYQTFMEITDHVHDAKEVEKILLLADNMPLAIDLMAHLVDYEGLSTVLNRWDTERTSILSEGHDHRSNLDLSIALSLSSPRITSSPQALDLLSLLSMLPDGLSDVELIQSNLPLDNILGCKSTLLRTALAYMDDHKRLKLLVPIREYLQKTQPPTHRLIHPLFQYFQELLQLYSEYQGTLSSVPIVPRIASNLSNIQNVLLHGLNPQNPDLAGIIQAACDLSTYSIDTGHGKIKFLDQISVVLPQLSDYRLEVSFMIQVFAASLHDLMNKDQLINEGLIQKHLQQLNDPGLSCGSLWSYFIS